MSNPIYIQILEMKRINHSDSEKFHMCRVSDEYEDGFFDIAEPEEDKDNIYNDNLALLKECWNMGFDVSKQISNIMDSIVEYQKGVTINEKYYEWGEIKHIFGK